MHYVVVILNFSLRSFKDLDLVYLLLELKSLLPLTCSPLGCAEPS